MKITLCKEYMKKQYKLIISIVTCQLAGIIGALFTTPAIPTWYATLVKPSFNPPSWLFGPAWTILYILMGISLYLIWTKKTQINKKSALIIFSLQLILNSLWSILFFGLKNPLLAFFEIIAMWLVILATIVKFYPISKKASYLLIPYILWVSFASVLNLFIVRLN
jgi:tryptophan-rich sensory protein